MAQTNINIRIDEDVKRQFDALCGELGMSMSTAFTVFAKAFIRQDGFPFEVNLRRASAETLEAMEDVNSGRNLSGPYRSMEELREALKNQSRQAADL